jgi:hypothetical protein
MRLLHQRSQKHLPFSVQSTSLGDDGLDKIILLSDCLSVVQRIDYPLRDRSLVGVIVEDIKTLAASMSSVTFRHVNRLCNNSAHSLTRRAELSGSISYRTAVPDFIRDKLCIDVF